MASLPTNASVSTEQRLVHVEALVQKIPYPEEGQPAMQKAAKTLVGAVASLAAAHKICPPEAAVGLLTDEDQDTIRELLEAIDFTAVTKRKQLHPDTALRINRLLDYMKEDE